MPSVTLDNSVWTALPGATTVTNNSAFTAFLYYGPSAASLAGGVGTIGVTLPPYKSFTVGAGNSIWAMSGSKFKVKLAY